MIQYTLHENNWTVMLDNFDFNSATQDDINEIAKLLATNTVVVARGQNLNVQDEVRIAKMFKDPQIFNTEDENSSDTMFQGAEVKDSDNMALRVTGEKDEHGRTGIAGHEDEMQWHANDQTTPNRKPLVWLYSVKGSKGSRTSWNNNILSYNNLPKEKREPLENLKLVPYQNVSLNENEDNSVGKVNYYPNLVMENIAGKRGFYFPFYQISGFKDMSDDESKEIINWLSEYTVRDEFCYHHDWEDGDVVIAEQWLGIHKRWPFKNIEERLLHRIAFDFPDQNYSS